MARDRGLRADVVVGEEVTTRGGHLLALYIERPIRRLSLASGHDHRGPRRRRPGRAGPPARPVSALRAGLRPPRSARGQRSAGPSRRVSRRSIPRCSDGPRTAASCISPTSTASPTSATATPTPSRRSATGWTAFPGSDAAALRRAIETRQTEHGGSFHGTAGQFGVFGRQLRKRAQDTRDELRGRLRRDGTGRDHGYPGGHLRPPRYEPDPDGQAR